VVPLVAVVVLAALLASGAVARDPRQAVIGDAELAKLPLEEQRRLGDLEQGQEGLVQESLPQRTSERLAADDDPAEALRAMPGYDDAKVLREAGVTVTLPDGFTSVRTEQVLSSDAARSAAGRTVDDLPPPKGEVRVAMYTLLRAGGGGTLSVMSGVGLPRALAIQEQLAAQAGAQAVRIGGVEAIRTGPPHAPHLQWATPGGTVVSLAWQDYDEATVAAIVAGVNGV